MVAPQIMQLFAGGHVKSQLQFMQKLMTNVYEKSIT